MADHMKTLGVDAELVLQPCAQQLMMHDEGIGAVVDPPKQLLLDTSGTTQHMRHDIVNTQHQNGRA